MLRQLASLTRPLPAAGPQATALAIYSAASGGPVGAPGEGVACVDDAARAVELLAAVWQKTRQQWVWEWAQGLLDFVLWMERGDGTWVNFVLDWDGKLNSEGVTSRAGVNFWQARGLAAAVAAATVFGHERAKKVAQRAFAAAADAPAPPDVRALHLMALLRWCEAGLAPPRSGLIERWAADIASLSIGQVLMNSPDERGAPHLWGHLQEVALLGAAGALGRPALAAVAESSAVAVFVPPIEIAFEATCVQPYEVQSAIHAMDALHETLRNPRYATRAAEARAWFGGRNSAHAAVYDRAAGRVADGVDHGRVSVNSGAESNVCGGLALLSEACASAVAMDMSRVAERAVS